MSQPMNDPGGKLSDCGCCEGLAAATPAVILNRPGLPAVAYRVGTHADFKRTMLARLTSADLPALAELRTRDDDDFAIALIDAWATVADVLTFSQERIANECFLGTATERLSLVELARLIGYRLKPGVAANAYLAFTLDEPVTPAGGPETALRSQPGPTGIATVDAGLKVQSVPGPGELPQTFETVESVEARAAWNAMRPERSLPQPVNLLAPSVWLQGNGHQLSVGDSILMVAPALGFGWAVQRRIAEVTPEPSETRTRLDLEQTFLAWGLVAASAPTGIWALRVDASPFGHNAALRPHYTHGKIDDPKDWLEWDLDGTESKVLPLDRERDVLTNDWVVVNRQNPSNASDRWFIVARALAVRTTSLAEFGLSGRVTELTLDLPWRFAGDTSLAQIRDAAVSTRSERLTLAEKPLDTPVTGATVVLDREVAGLEAGRRVAVVGLDAATGEPVAEVVTIQKVELTGTGRTRLSLSPPLAESYRRDTVVISGNVVAASHGETVRELLGSGDATRSYQEIELKQKPLTYVAAPPSGAQTTLEVRVGDVRWYEVPSLLGLGPRDRVYTTRRADDGTVTVQFGDGLTGTRPPTGQNNLRATYRKGIGTGAMVDAGRLTQLMTRPLGVKDVLNPLPAEGAEDPETLDDARGNAPLAVRTLGRVVSLLDYQDFARAFPGIGKAFASWSWDGEARRVVLTVAGADGHAITVGGTTHEALVDSLLASGDPHIGFLVLPHEARFFTLSGTLTVDPDSEPDSVLAKAVAALCSAFSFERRGFAQPVMRSEALAVLHTVPGVVAVDLDLFHRTDRPPSREPWLDAAPPQPGPDGTLRGAELLLIDTDPLGLKAVTS